MAEVTVTSTRSPQVWGSDKVVTYLGVAAAGTGDTLTASQLNTVHSVIPVSATGVACGYTLSGKVITLVYAGGGALTLTAVHVIGK